MQHLPDEDLTALALGEAVERSEHVDECRACACEVASLRRTADILIAALVEPVQPPAALWQRTLDEIEAEAAAAPTVNPTDGATLRHEGDQRRACFRRSRGGRRRGQ
ncbi:hypothetical protein [Agrococcus sp. ProA11]|uniref:hypothetical protein n=1 Tax=Agrococcus chionoecetis TaxID=3153752 RepID=UPI00326023B0